MKRILFILFITMNVAVCNISAQSMSLNQIRRETRFLTDKMAYELNLDTRQYNDVYEINYDFMAQIRYLMDNVLSGEEWALDRYYNYLDRRNDDLHWVLSNRQYKHFIRTDYFFRPVYTNEGYWRLRIYIAYPDRNLFYFSLPHFYHTYRGAHYQKFYGGVSYYQGRYKHSVYKGKYRIHDRRSYAAQRRPDFSSIHFRSDSSRKSSRGTSVMHHSGKKSRDESKRIIPQNSRQINGRKRYFDRNSDSHSRIKNEMKSSREDNESSSAEKSYARSKRSVKTR